MKDSTIKASAKKLGFIQKPTDADVIDMNYLVKPINSEAKAMDGYRDFDLTMTPALAKRLLSQKSDDHRQREINDEVVKTYAKIIARGNWRMNFLPIIQDWNGDIIDGQHRLKGIVLSDTPAPMRLVKGADPSLFDTYDNQFKRTTIQIFKMLMKSVKYGTTVVPAIKFLYYFNEGLYLQSKVEKFNAFDNPKMTEFCKHNKDIIFEIEDFAGEVHAGDNIFHSPSKLTAFYYIFNKIDSEVARKFMDQFLHGYGLFEESPVGYIRRRFTKVHLARNEQFSDNDKFYLLIRAWNDFYDHGVMTAEKYSLHGKVPEISGYSDDIKLYNKPPEWNYDDELSFLS